MSVDPPTYRLLLSDPGPDRRRVILELRALRPDLTLPDAKALVEGGGVLIDSVGYWDVDQVMRRLTRTGAVIEKVQNETEV